MTPALSSVTQSLSSLLRQATLDDHEEVLKAANATLQKTKNDPEALHVKVIALIKLDRYDDALKVIDNSGAAIKDRAVLERAYALYKLGRFQEAEDAAKNSGTERGAQHIEAQAAYREENFLRAAEIYRSLAAGASDVENEENDLRINQSAVQAQRIWAGDTDLGEVKRPSREDLEAFEPSFNAACASIANNELGHAEILLKRARDLCSASDDLTDEVKQSELLPILVQQVYVLSRLRRSEEAAALIANISIEDISDPSTRHIALTNLLACSRETFDPYLASRRFHTTSSIPAWDQPFRFQSTPLLHNAYVLELLSHKQRGVAKSTARQLAKSKDAASSPQRQELSVSNAAAVGENQADKAGLKKILPLLESRPNDPGLILTIVQLHAQKHHYQSAVAQLESLFHRLEELGTDEAQDIRFAPGLVAVLVVLYSAQGRKRHVRTELAKAATFWRQSSKPPANLIQAAGVSLLDSSDPEDLSLASNIFTELRSRNPNDRQAVAGYIASRALTSPAEVSADLEKLTPVDRLVAGVDATALEESGVPQQPSLTDGMAARKRRADEISKPTKKRFRKSRHPATKDPSKPPDPERWLPLKERSSYRPKGKRGKQKAAALTQGGMASAGQAEGLDVSGAGVAKADKSSKASGKSKKKKGKGAK